MRWREVEGEVQIGGGMRKEKVDDDLGGRR